MVAGHGDREERVKVMALEFMVVLLVVEIDFEEGLKRRLKEVEVLVILEVEVVVMEVVL